MLGKPISITDLKLSTAEEATKYIQRYNNVVEKPANDDNNNNENLDDNIENDSKSLKINNDQDSNSPSSKYK